MAETVNLFNDLILSLLKESKHFDDLKMKGLNKSYVEAALKIIELRDQLVENTIKEYHKGAEQDG